MRQSINDKKQVLEKYLPREFLDYTLDLISQYPVRVRISRPRKTKLGDFRYSKTELHQISVNGDLNPYAFLITLIHEFAHLVSYNDHGVRIKPHGKEWQKCYARLLRPVIDSDQLPGDIEHALINSLVNIKASSCSDKGLYKVLLRYDPMDHETSLLEEISINSKFELNGKTFSKGELRRSRYVCMENHTQKIYLVSSLAKVKVIKDEE